MDSGVNSCGRIGTWAEDRKSLAIPSTVLLR